MKREHGFFGGTNYLKRLLMPLQSTLLKTQSEHSLWPHPHDSYNVFVFGCTHVLAYLCYLCIFALIKGYKEKSVCDALIVGCTR